MSAMRPARGHGYAYRCETCDTMPDWSVTRVGDVRMTWACGAHLAEACERFYRGVHTELTVKPAVMPT